ncbi:hypothetical protein V6N11_034234 [Hibiscus sabdariffa]|uniref:RNase H type-1 domain-containing protein n=2 Tax=Hibiscus sabdariffa TaxID=183260 RepID=A0ABR1Z6V6_9ROSI
MLNAIHVDKSIFPLVLAIVKLHWRDWITDVIWIPRHGNRVVDMIAKTTDSSTLDVVHLHTPPRYLLLLFHCDAPDISFAQT